MRLRSVVAAAVVAIVRGQDASKQGLPTTDMTDFGSDSSGASDGGAWTPTPTTDVDSGSRTTDWSSWRAPSSSSSSSSSGSGSTKNTDYDDEAGAEYVFPDLDGRSIASLATRSYRFNASQGFSYGTSINATTSTTTSATIGRCPHSYCVHLSFESEYGVTSPFDAFVIDRYESRPGLVGFEGGALEEGGPLPFIVGRGVNESAWDEGGARVGSNATTWTLFPADESSRVIDLRLSLKRLFALPARGVREYLNGSANSSRLLTPCQALYHVVGKVGGVAVQRSRTRTSTAYTSLGITRMPGAEVRYDYYRGPTSLV